MIHSITITAEYKLVDYNVPTAGRLAALLFNYKNIDFEYVQVDKSKAHEQETASPFGSLPVLYVNDEILATDYAICMYIARVHGLEGKDAKDAARCATIVTGIAQLFSTKLMGGKDIRDKLPKYLRSFDKLLRRVNTGYFVGEQITWADLAVAFSCHQIQARSHGALDRHPNLNDHYLNMYSIPAVKKFLEETCPSE
ncbi:glutathione S-transferase 4-like [Galendromus occidentalis]|uniref:Glutathione S-transferase 4-like n=1 Tax=Galendromus occidentalis TaxID=34638 RepID=A0AAJ7WHT6_9ACAR|nr:glutathione S-transferase 4-like [Galendromus occidentalis]